MAGATADLLLRVRADLSQAAAGIRALETQATSFASGGGIGATAAGIDQIGASVAAAEPRVQSLQSKLSAMLPLGLALTGISAGITAFGASALNAGADYQAAMAKVQGLTGASADEMVFFNQSILGMRNSTVGPTELAQALYPIRSLIHDDADAMNVLTTAAAASEAGLGKTADVANVLTSAMKAYGLSAQSAGQLTDEMIAAVTAGKMDPTTLPNALSKVLPSAAANNVSFGEVLANIATTSAIGMSTDIGATALNQLLTGFDKATPQTAKALAKIGLTPASIRDEIKNLGLEETLADVFKRTGGDITLEAQIFPNARALRDFLAAPQGQAADYKATLDAINNSMGRLDSAESIAAATAKSQWQIMNTAIQQVQVTIFGLNTGPIGSLTASVTQLANGFMNLSPATQSFIVAGVGLVGVLAGLTGAAILIGPSILTMGMAFGVSTAAMIGMLGPIGIVGAAVVGFGILYTTNFLGMRDITNTAVTHVVSDLTTLGRALSDLVQLGNRQTPYGSAAATTPNNPVGRFVANAEATASGAVQSVAPIALLTAVFGPAVTAADLLTAAYNRFGGALKTDADRAADFSDAIARLSKEAPPSWFDTAPQWLTGQGTAPAAVWQGPLLQEGSAVATAYGRAVLEASNATQTFIGPLLNEGGAAINATGGILGLDSATQSLIASQQAAASSAAVFNALGGTSTLAANFLAADPAASALDSQIQGVNDHINSLRDAASQAGTVLKQSMLDAIPGLRAYDAATFGLSQKLAGVQLGVEQQILGRMQQSAAAFNSSPQGQEALLQQQLKVAGLQRQVQFGPAINAFQNAPATAPVSATNSAAIRAAEDQLRQLNAAKAIEGQVENKLTEWQFTIQPKLATLTPAEQAAAVPLAAKWAEFVARQTTISAETPDQQIKDYQDFLTQIRTLQTSMLLANAPQAYQQGVTIGNAWRTGLRTGMTGTGEGINAGLKDLPTASGSFPSVGGNTTTTTVTAPITINATVNSAADGKMLASQIGDYLLSLMNGTNNGVAPAANGAPAGLPGGY